MLDHIEQAQLALQQHHRELLAACLVNKWDIVTEVSLGRADCNVWKSMAVRGEKSNIQTAGGGKTLACIAKEAKVD